MPEKHKFNIENLSAVSTTPSSTTKQTPEQPPEMSRQLLNKLKVLQIIPDIFLNDFAPTCHCVVQYGKHNVQDATDTPVHQHDAAVRPKIHLMPFDMSSDLESSLASSSTAHAQQGQHFYDIIMVDPDAPSRNRPSAREWLHMVIANVPLSNESSIHSASRELLLSEGEELVKYAGPTPPEGTGYHRYCFFVFRHAGKNEMRHMLHWRDMKRAGFRIEEFAQKAGLGQPIACTSFLCQHEKI